MVFGARFGQAQSLLSMTLLDDSLPVKEIRLPDVARFTALCIMRQTFSRG